MRADTPYDAQMVLEHIAHYARGQRCLRITLRDHQWTVTQSGGETAPCDDCARERHRVLYQIDDHRLCRVCASRWLTHA